MVIIATAAVFATVFLFLFALGGSQGGVRSRLDTLRAQPFDDRPAARPTVGQRMVSPFVDVVVSNVKRVMPTTMLEGLQKRLVQAGEPMGLNQFLMLQVVTTVGFLFLPLLVMGLGGIGSQLMMILAVGAFGVGGFFMPHLWLQQRMGQRRNHIIKSLPNAFDLITTCVEAGLGLDAALSRVAEKVEGPFADELTRTLREVGLGKMRREALRELGERTGVPDLVSFVNAVIQAEQMGSSVGTVLRVQADQLRIRRRQRAEEQAYKAPIKMIFPLVLCIFPTLFIVILGPAVITVMRDFPK